MTEGKRYNPLSHSAVQATHGYWSEYQADDFHEALLRRILDEVERVHWNVYQHRWTSDRAEAHGVEPSQEDPEISGVQFRYCNEDDNPDPNFACCGVEFRWYKSIGRGMSVNRTMSAEEWRSWFDRCLSLIRRFEDETDSDQKEKLRESFWAKNG